MSVSILLCEGASNSPDVRVLSKLLASLCEIKPSGGKYGMGTHILARREALSSSVVFGILDRDFIKDWNPPIDKPVQWQSKDSTIHFGWKWERKEIENYILDPIIVDKALSDKGPSISKYTNALYRARDSLTLYEAARIALSANRPRFKELVSSFGKKHAHESHYFPDVLDEKTCREGIIQAIKGHEIRVGVDEGQVLKAFDKYKFECSKGGVRYKSFLYAFSGKDLLWAMNDWFKTNGYDGAWSFREKVILGIQRTMQDISTWLPEWKELQRIVKSL